MLERQQARLMANNLSSTLDTACATEGWAESCSICLPFRKELQPPATLTATKITCPSSRVEC